MPADNKQRKGAHPYRKPRSANPSDPSSSDKPAWPKPTHRIPATEARDEAGIPGLSKLKSSIRQTKRLLAKVCSTNGRRQLLTCRVCWSMEWVWCDRKISNQDCVCLLKEGWLVWRRIWLLLRGESWKRRMVPNITRYVRLLWYFWYTRIGAKSFLRSSSLVSQHLNRLSSCVDVPLIPDTLQNVKSLFD